MLFVTGQVGLIYRILPRTALTSVLTAPQTSQIILDSALFLWKNCLMRSFVDRLFALANLEIRHGRCDCLEWYF